MLASLVGLGDAIYLTVQHLTGRSVRCTIVAGCSAVLSSRYATFGGIPTAAWGAVAYFLAFSGATLALFGYRQVVIPLRLLAAVMVAMTIWLLYLQAMVIHAFCSYCLISASATTIIAVSLLLAARGEASGE